MSKHLCNKLIKLIPTITVNLLQKRSIYLSIKCYAGHSKWQNIRHTKALKDGQKSLQFIKLTRQIRLAVQSGGSANPAVNSQLRATIDDALKHNMPQSTIQNVLKKCSNTTDQQPLKRQVIELRCGIRCNIFAIAILYSDNFTGARMQLTPILKKHAAIQTDCRHLFYEKGFIDCYGTNDIFSDTSIEHIEEIATEHAIESNAEELEIIDSETKHLMFICNPIDIDKCKQKLSAIGYRIESFEHMFIPNNPIVLANDDELQQYQVLKEKLLKFDGIDEVYDNLKNS